MTPVDLPGPWRWTDRYGDFMLVAADHREPNDPGGYHESIVLSERIMCVPGEMSPYVREVVRSAPEMEQLLRDYLALTARVFGHQERHAYEDGGEVCLHCTNVAILERLDAASKEGG